MSAPREVLELVDVFDRNREAYRSAQYNEMTLRLQFLDPLFKALGWDVHNVQGTAEAYKDVLHEDAIKVGGATKAPDYCFRYGCTRKFFVEAKKPTVNIKEDVSPAYQLRRYAWSAKLPLSILTDFEEFAVYDCRVKPAPTDKAATGRILLLGYQEYPQRWDEIASIFSREAVRMGVFDKHAESTKAKKGTAGVDAAFLKEIESWRDMLARNLALRNPELTQRELNFAVQRIIDRIIFLRIAEDRHIEDYGRLMALTNGERVYKRLCEIFERADERYNSGLFHFQKERDRTEPPDELTLRLKLDDDLLAGIIRSLYYPESPYEFSVLPADILGQVYEQFLGKVIRLTPGHRAIVEDKPEVKKAGGVYYTPTYIVDYIVRHTVGKLLGDSAPSPSQGEGRGEGSGRRTTPKQAAKLRILDPACGSGSFLIGAYQFLLDWHRDWYESDGAERHTKELYQGPGCGWRLTTAERKRILLANIYGVDIDPQAVETTKLSLLLKVLEGESHESLERQRRLFHERALPDLANNIKCGNSLIGPDFYDQQQMSLLDDDERYRINVFDWHAEFPEIMKSGGFDAVIGNPPYLRIQGLQEHYGTQIEYFGTHYESAVKRFDLYLLFVERGLGLLADDGKLGFICPHKFVNGDFGSGLRKLLLDNTAIESIVSFGNNLIFNQASPYTCILMLSRVGNTSFAYYEFPDTAAAELPVRLSHLPPVNFRRYDHGSFTEAPWVLTSTSAETVFRRLRGEKSTLGTAFDQILVGVQSGIDSVHVLRAAGTTTGDVLELFSERANAVIDIEAELVKPFLRGEDVHRYEQAKHSYYCIYPYELKSGKTTIIEEEELRERFPRGHAYLKEYRKELAQIRIRQKTNPAYWYACHRSRDMCVFENGRIITPEISLGCNMTLVPAGIYHNTMVYSLVPSPGLPENKLYWLGLLNSKVMWWFLANTGNVLRGGYFRFKTNYIGPFPVHAIDFSEPADKSRHDRMVELVERMLAMHKQLAAAKTSHDRTSLERQIEATDRQIDRLVYELYGLTDEEIAIVEEATAR